MTMANGISNNSEALQVDSKVIPVMREAITTVQMVLFKVLRDSIIERYGSTSKQEQTQLAGAVVNNLFGTLPTDPAVKVYGAENRETVESELKGLATHCQDLMPFLTDALRMKTICDNQEGLHSIPSLLMAKALGLLLEDRVLPMPSTFMLSVRTLATKYGIVEPIQAAPPPEE